MSKSRYLHPDIFSADPSAHVFNGRVYVYPSHDIDGGVPFHKNGDHFCMRDYHVYSLDEMNGEVTDHGVALDIDDVPWAGRQMWAPDAAEKDGSYFFYFPAKDKQDLFRIGVAVGNRPEGPFKARPEAMCGSYSVDPAVFKDDDGQYYMYFGGIWGGQLEWYRDNARIKDGAEPPDDEPALGPKIARLQDDMLEFAEAPREILILDQQGNPLKAGDHERRYFEGPWMHKYNGTYYLSYSTGNTHLLCYATADNPYGPFSYRGVLLTPVVGWTTHHSICEVRGKWYLFHHDSKLSGGVAHLRNIKVQELNYNDDGSIITLDGMA